MHHNRNVVMRTRRYGYRGWEVPRRVGGAGDGIRTRDINLGKVALYQLSYSRVAEPSLSLSGMAAVNFKVPAIQQVT
jgi:hypothetical protein